MAAPKDTVINDAKGSVPVPTLSFDDEEKLIRDVNSKYNQSITFERGKEGWQLNNLPDGGMGDCDTYARTKGEALVKAGMDKGKLAIVVHKLWNGVDHATLRVDRGNGKYVYLTNPQNRMQTQYPEATILADEPGEPRMPPMQYDDWETRRILADAQQREKAGK